MNIWSTFRFVPPISPQAMAWATLSFATYLAAVDMQPMLWGRALDPLALALAVQMALSLTNNLTSDRFIDAMQFLNNRICIVSAIVTVIAVFAMCGILAVTASGATAAKLFILYQAAHAFKLAYLTLYAPEALYRMVGTWTFLKKHVQNAVMLESLGITVTALTLSTVWTFAGPLAFAGMMSFGVLALRVLSNWAIVMYLLDAEQQASDE